MNAFARAACIVGMTVSVGCATASPRAPEAPPASTPGKYVCGTSTYWEAAQAMDAKCDSEKPFSIAAANAGMYYCCIAK